jgi:hypothetical protein
VSGHDTDPPPPAPVTTPLLEDDEAPASLDIPPILAGEAELRLNDELNALVAAFRRVDATASAIARALDATAVK